MQRESKATLHMRATGRRQLSLAQVAAQSLLRAHSPGREMAFKRPFHAQSRTPVRSSDVRRFRDSLGRQFPSLDSDALKLLTKDLLVAKAHTHLDEPCTVYYAPNRDPRFFKLQDDDDWVPTCYAFDLVAAHAHGQTDWIPTLGTAPAVVQNLISGSALFAAGVSPRDLANLVAASSSSSTSPSSARKGSLVGITVASSPNPRRIVAVGRLAADPGEIQHSQRDDKGGKAVLTLHARGDFLWQAGSKLEPAAAELDLDPRQNRLAEDEGAHEDDDAQVAQMTDRLAAATDLSRSNSTASSSTAASLSAPPPASSSRSAKKGKGKKADTPTGPIDKADATTSSTDALSSTAPASTTDSLTPAEADSVLLNALLLALSTSAALQKPATFPLPASSLYSTYILPFRPASPPSHATVDLKKSSFKKLDRFVKQVVKKGWIAAKELKKGTGDWIVTSVESRHPDVERAPRYRTVAELAGASAGSDNADATLTTTTATRGSEPNAAALGGASTAGSSSGSGGGGGVVEVRELWKLSGDSVKELFRSVPHDRSVPGLSFARDSFFVRLAGMDVGPFLQAGQIVVEGPCPD